jgi:hypothetical protein
MGIILAIDPGPTESAWVEYIPLGRTLNGHAKEDNRELLARLEWQDEGELLVLERVASYGRPVGAEVFLTCEWLGRFWQAWMSERSVAGSRCVRAIERRTVKRHLCGSENKVNDAVIRQRLIDLWGGKEAAIGRKSKPGPLYGIHGDCWQALALAVTAVET